MIWRAQVNVADLQDLAAKAKRDGQDVHITVNASEDDAHITVTAETGHGGRYALVCEHAERLS